MTLSNETVAEIERLRDLYPRPRSAVLPSLWAVQHEFGYVKPEGMEDVANLLGLAASDVQAVATFYSMYFAKPPGRHHAIVCTNVSCALRGADAIVAHVEKALGCLSGETTSNGEFTWESTVECLGACGGAPAMQVDHHFYENLTPARVDQIFSDVAGSPGALVLEHQETAPAKKPATKRVTKKSKSPDRPKLKADDL